MGAGIIYLQRRPALPTAKSRQIQMQLNLKNEVHRKGAKYAKVREGKQIESQYLADNENETLKSYHESTMVKTL
jgi:hypothetical protein